jgi:hypothetical protein
MRKCLFTNSLMFISKTARYIISRQICPYVKGQVKQLILYVMVLLNWDTRTDDRKFKKGEEPTCPLDIENKVSAKARYVRCQYPHYNTSIFKKDFSSAQSQ